MRSGDLGRWAAHSGFTLIELLVVLTVLGILATLAMPAFTTAALNNTLSSYANSFVGTLQLARGEAIKRNAVVTVCRSASGTACATSGTWQQGWVVLASDGTVLQSREALSSDYHVTSSDSVYSLVFQPSGVGTTNSVVTVCKASPSAGNQERVITVGTTGRATVATTMTGVCS